MRSALALAGFLALAYAAAVFGSLFTPGEWYAALAKPRWTPPGWVFPLVWTPLYATIGVSAWLVWRRAGFAGAKVAFAAFFVQLALNAAWSWLFFGLQRPGLALVEIVALFFAILATVEAFWRVVPAAGALLLPYLLWVGFASALNTALWRMNP